MAFLALALSTLRFRFRFKLGVEKEEVSVEVGGARQKREKRSSFIRIGSLQVLNGVGEPGWKPVVGRVILRYVPLAVSSAAPVLFPALGL